MAENITVLLIEDSPDYAALVQQWLEPRQDISFTLNWTDTLEAGLRRLGQGGVDVVLMDLGLPDSEGLQTFSRLRPRTAGIPVIVLSAGEDEALAIQTVQAGAQDYLVKNACNAETLVRSLRYAILRHHKQSQASTLDSAAQLSKVIGVMGASGGAGATTVACHMAVELRKQTGQKVFLADLDLQGGMLSFLMKLDSSYSMLDAAHNLHRLDADCWKTLVSRTPEEVEVLGSPTLLGQPAMDAQGVGEVLSVIRSFYDWIIIDLGRLNEFTLGMLDKTNELLLVTGAEVSALYQTRRLIQEMSSTVLDKDRLRIVLNRVSAGTKLGSRDVEKIFGSPVHATLPADPAGARNAETLGKLLSETSPLREGIAELARRLAGLETKKTRRWPSLTPSNLFNKGKRQSDLQTADT